MMLSRGFFRCDKTKESVICTHENTFQCNKCLEFNRSMKKNGVIKMKENSSREIDTTVGSTSTVKNLPNDVLANLSLCSTVQTAVSKLKNGTLFHRSDESLNNSLPFRRRAVTVTKSSDRCLYGTYPSCNFGPKAAASNQTATLTIQDPGCQIIQWRQKPTSVLFVYKMDSFHGPCSSEKLTNSLLDFIKWLITTKSMLVHIEDTILHDTCLPSSDIFKEIQSDIFIFNRKDTDITQEIDIVVCVGSDSSLIYVSSLFQTNIPPVIAFRFDVHGFLLPYPFCSVKEELDQILSGEKVNITLRTRLVCTLSKTVTVPLETGDRKSVV